MNEYYVLKEDMPMSIVDNRHGNMVRKTLIKGTFFSSGELINESIVKLFFYNNDLSPIIIDINKTQSVPESFINKDGRNVNLFNHRNDYSISIEGFGFAIACNVNALSEWSSLFKVDNVKQVKYIDLFKYLPVQTYGIKGFYNNGYNVSFDSKGKINTQFVNLNGNKIEQFFSLLPIIEQCSFKVINYIDSSKMFKFTELKKSMAGLIFKGSDLELGCEIKDVLEPQHTVKLILKEGDRKTRFLLSDLEIIYPNITSFNAPKSRVIEKGVKVKVADNRHISISKNTIVNVLDLKNVGKGKGCKKYAIVELNNKQFHVKLKSLRVC